MRHAPILFSKEVKTAIKNKQPIIALESSIISHGMPYPDNLKCVTVVENIVRKQCVTPATIALQNGQIHIGIEESLKEKIASSDDILKASRQDLAFILSKKKFASTSVAAAMYCAHLAKISILATGGIGGVHPKVSKHFDVSANIIELANTPVTVICSGAKSILDLPNTLEMLETQGIPVVGYRTDEFPAFYSHTSGISPVHRLNSANEIAELIVTQHQLGLRNGIVVANPIPKEAEIADEQLLPIIEKVHQDTNHLNEKSITPYLLKRIAELTEGQSLQANFELIKNNAYLGAKVALALRKKL